MPATSDMFSISFLLWFPSSSNGFDTFCHAYLFPSFNKLFFSDSQRKEGSAFVLGEKRNSSRCCNLLSILYCSGKKIDCYLLLTGFFYSAYRSVVSTVRIPSCSGVASDIRSVGMSVGTHLILLIKAAIEDLKIRVDGCRPDTGQTRRWATSRFSRLELLKSD